MDEPLSNLDAKLRVSTRAQIKNLSHELAITTIYVTHDQVEAMTLADRVVVMKQGVVQQVGSPTDIYDMPANSFVAGFIGSPAMNLIEGKISKGVLFNQLQNNGYRIDQLENYFKNKISSEDCFSQNPLIQDQGYYVKYLNKFVCSVQQPRFNFNLFFDLNLTHLDFSSQERAGQLFPDFIISSDNRQIYIFDENQSPELNLSFLNFLSFGFKHILSGLDHIAFLLLIIFLCANLKTLFFAISGFTLGHSASLFSSVQGLIVSSTNLVEIMIGFSILVCSIEVLGKKTAQLGMFSNLLLVAWAILTFSIYIFLPKQSLFFLSLGLMMFCYLRLSDNYQSRLNLIFITIVFGFIHGLGFAGAINEIFLPKEDMLKILFAFNLGIEVGQILIFGIFALFAYFLEFYKLAKLRDFATFAITASIFGYSLNLIIERSFLVF